MRDYRLRYKLLEILLKSGLFFNETFLNQRIVNMLNVKKQTNKKQNKNQNKTKEKTPPPKKKEKREKTKIMKHSGQH